MKIWADRYGKSKHGEPTKLYKLYKQLFDKGVIFPQDYIFVDPIKIKKTTAKKKEAEK